MENGADRSEAKNEGLPNISARSHREKDYLVTIIDSVEDIDSFALEWKEFLESRAKERLLAHDPSAVRFALVKDKQNCSPRIIIVRHKGIISCIAPCYVRRTRFRLRFSIIQLPAPTARLLMIYGNSPALAEDADTDACMNAVFNALDPKDLGFDLISIENLFLSSDLWKWLQARYVSQRGRFRFLISSPKIEKAHVHRLLDSHDVWLNKFSGKRRRKIKWQIKQLFEHLPGKVQLVKVTEPDQVSEFLDRLNEIYPLTWQGRSLGAWERNTLENTEYFEKTARNRWLRSYMLMCEEGAVAYIIGFQYAGTFDYNETGYDQKYTKYSPGAVLNYLMLEDLYTDNRPQVLSFGYGHGEYKERLGNEVYDTCSVYLVSSKKWLAIVSLQRVLNWIYGHLREWLINLRIDSLIRRLLKRKN